MFELGVSAPSCELLVFSIDQLSYEREANKISTFPSERNSRSLSGASTGRAKWLLIPHVTCWHISPRLQLTASDGPDKLGARSQT